MNLGDVTQEAQSNARMAPATPRPCIRYEAATPQGTWRLRLAFGLDFDDQRGAPQGGAAAAQALLRAEDLLVALDTWCVEAGLDPLPWGWSAAQGPAPGRLEAGPPRSLALAAPRGGASAASERPGAGDGPASSNHGDVSDHGRAARARWLGDAGSGAVGGAAGGTVGVTLGAPWAALRLLGEPPPNLQAALRWDDAWAVCVLDRFALDADDEARLEPGGAVLIAASLRSPWRGALRGAGEADDAGLAFDLAAAEGGVAIVATPADVAAASVPAASSAASPAVNWEIRSLHPVRVPVPVLFGWAQAPAPWPRALFTELELARCSAASAPRPYMPGGLMPWSRGVAMLLAHG